MATRPTRPVTYRVARLSADGRTSAFRDVTAGGIVALRQQVGAGGDLVALHAVGISNAPEGPVCVCTILKLQFLYLHPPVYKDCRIWGLYKTAIENPRDTWIFV